MGKGVADSLFAGADEVVVAQQITQSQQTVRIVGRLLIAPPVLGIRVFVLAFYLASPQAGVIGISHGLGMSRQTRCLT